MLLPHVRTSWTPAGYHRRPGGAAGGRYRFTAKLKALLAPAAVVTVTCAAPRLAVAGAPRMPEVGLGVAMLCPTEAS
ncbi:MAG: hypothetical protein WCP98_07125 [Actinomycetes bacterium]